MEQITTEAKIIKTTITMKVYNLTTDDIEKILIKALDLSETAEIRWNIGQWCSLSITEKETEVEMETKPVHRKIYQPSKKGER